MCVFLRAIVLSFLACILGTSCVKQAGPALRFEQPTLVKATLGAGDVIDLRVFGEEDLSGEYQVSPEGTLRLPLIGRIIVEGLSMNELAVKVTDLYNAKYLKNAQVSVFVKAYNSRRIYVLGQVRTAGPFDYDENMTVIAAIALAGGLGDSADASRTIVTRTVDNEKTRFKIDVNKIGRGRESDFMLRPGDIVFVPRSMF